MANGNGHDRHDEGGGGSFVMGLLTGTVLGAGLGLLFAPKAGSELRGQIAEQTGSLATSATEGYRNAAETAAAWAEKGREKGRELYDKGREAVVKGADEAQRYAREAANAAESASAWAEKGREKGQELYDKGREGVVKGAEEAQRYAREAGNPFDTPRS